MKCMKHIQMYKEMLEKNEKRHNPKGIIMLNKEEEKSVKNRSGMKNGT